MKRQLEWRHCWCVAAILGVALVAVPALAQTRQEHVHDMGQNVMPFDLAKTMHIFRMTDIGGVQSVVVRDANARDQIALIQQHLQREAKAFQAGNYADPSTLHGKAMPGIAELQSQHAKIAVSYSALPLGAEIIFRTADLHLVTAIHRWFGAQLSEHGADARAE